LVCFSNTLEVLTVKLLRAAGLVLGVAELSFIRTITTVIIMVTHPALQESDSVYCTSKIDSEITVNPENMSSFVSYVLFTRPIKWMHDKEVTAICPFALPNNRIWLHMVQNL
jgi:hypothetical protein